MRLREVAVVGSISSIWLMGGSAVHAGAEQGRASNAQQEPRGAGAPVAFLNSGIGNEFPITVRPDTLAAMVDEFAGGSVRLTHARVVGVFDPRVFLIESQTRLPTIIDRGRVLVFVEGGSLRVDPATLVASTVTVSGIARTLLGMQTNHEVPWPKALTPDAVKRLEVRAAVLAKSVRTPEGIDLLTASS